MKLAVKPESAEVSHPLKSLLPGGWEWVPFGELIAFSQNGIGKRHGENGQDTVVLRLADISDGRISSKDYRLIKLTGEEIEKYRLEDGDLVCIRVNGSPRLVGRMIPFVAQDIPLT